MTLLSSGSVPTGASGCVMFGMVSRAACRSSSTCLSCFSRPADLLAQRFALGDQLLLLGRVFFLGDELGDLVLPLLERLRLLGEALAVVVELDDAVDVGLDVAVGGSWL